MSWTLRILLPAVWLGAVTSVGPGGEPAPQQPGVRRPIAACLLPDQRLLVANRDRGSLSVIDTETFEIRSESRIGGRLSDVAALPDSRFVVVLDADAPAVLLVSTRDQTVHARRELPSDPVSVVVHNDQLATVAALWDRKLLWIAIDPVAESSGRLQIAGSLALPFNPRLQLPLPSDRLLVADAFGGHLAVIDLQEQAIVAEHELPAHNIGGLHLGDAGRSVILTHQFLNSAARTTGDDIHWGMLMENRLRTIRLDELVSPTGNLLAGGRVMPLGMAGSGSGDPGTIVPGVDGEWLVAIGGTGQVLSVPLESRSAVEFDVGRRPVEIVRSPDRPRAYVLDMFGDHVAVLDLASEQVTATISLGPSPPLTPAQRGEQLFFNARLSHDNWMSCHSCHTDGYSHGGLADTLADGTYGTPKRILPLGGTFETGNWAWDGHVKELHSQIISSVATSMRGSRSFPTSQASDIVAFLQTLPPAPPLLRNPTPDERQVIERGRLVFEQQQCGRCHVPPLTYTIDLTFDVGLQDEAGLRKFNPPSLRGVGQRRRLLHDGRAESLTQLFTEHGHQVDGGLSDQDLGDLVTFLRSL